MTGGTLGRRDASPRVPVCENQAQHPRQLQDGPWERLCRCVFTTEVPADLPHTLHVLGDGGSAGRAVSLHMWDKETKLPEASPSDTGSATTKDTDAPARGDGSCAPPHRAALAGVCENAVWPTGGTLATGRAAAVTASRGSTSPEAEPCHVVPETSPSSGKPLGEWAAR